MDFLPDKRIVDEQLFSESMDTVLSDLAKTCKNGIAAPKKKFERTKFLEAMNEAFDQIGGIRRLSVWGDQNPTEFYKLYSKTIPQSTMLDVMGKLTHYIRPALPPSALDGEFKEITDESQENP